MVDYFPVLVFYVFFSLAVPLCLVSISLYLSNYQLRNFEKMTPYECGFDPFSDTHLEFEVRFYLVAILFIVFDLEIMFFFPWMLIIDTMNVIEFFVMTWFVIVIVVGFFYEWSKGAMDWLMIIYVNF